MPLIQYSCTWLEGLRSAADLVDLDLVANLEFRRADFIRHIDEFGSAAEIDWRRRSSSARVFVGKFNTTSVAASKSPLITTPSDLPEISIGSSSSAEDAADAAAQGAGGHRGLKRAGSSSTPRRASNGVEDDPARSIAHECRERDQHFRVGVRPVRAADDDRVAAGFALAADPARHEPHGRMKEQQRFDEPLQRGSRDCPSGGRGPARAAAPFRFRRATSR